MWATLKVYASGGENGLHAHPNEDHMFVVLQGSARFFGPNEETADLGKYQGIMLPAGSYYKFQSTSEEPLVLMRVGCQAGTGDPSGRLNIAGEPMPGDSKENGRVPVIPRPNAYFG
jgi:mannose-6-phosphate isomerase-like protein (cupin superfamily)